MILDWFVCLISHKFRSLDCAMEVMAVASCSGIRSKVESCPICAGFHIRGRA
jgi:hypothetical protein